MALLISQHRLERNEAVAVTIVSTVVLADVG